MRIRRTITAALSASFLLAGVAACGDDDDDGSDTPVTIASQSFPEAALVTALYQVLLDENGFDVDTKLVDTRDAYMADFPDDVDVVPEYLSAIGDFLNVAANGEGAAPVTSNDTDATLAAVQPLADEEGITLLEPAGGQLPERLLRDPGVLRVRGRHRAVRPRGPDRSRSRPRRTVRAGRTARAASPVSTASRSRRSSPTGFASPETYTAVSDGEAELGLTGTIEPTVEEDGYIRLEDDRGIQPAQNLIPAVSSEFLADNEDVEGLLNDLMAALDNDTLNELLGRVTLDREKAEDVAEDFLESEGLID